MRLKVSALAAVSVLALSAPAQAFTISLYGSQAGFSAAAPYAGLLEDFESVTGAQLDGPLASLARASGVYNPISGGAGNVFVSSAGYTNYGAGNNPTTSKILTANGDEAFEGLLTNSANALGMSVYLNDLGPATLSFYSGATFLGSLTWLSDADTTNNRVFGGIVTDQLVTRFTFVSTLGGQLNTGVDDILAGSVGGVPEPATWALMIAGFGLAGGSLRRRGAAQLQ